MKVLAQAAAAFVALSIPATASAQVYDATPTVGFTYGSGNDYTPANAVVLTTSTGELALRVHVPKELATPTGGTGLYTFALGSPVSFDFSVFGSGTTGANLTITNLLTGDDASFAAALLGTLQPSGAIQGSQQLGFGFLNGTLLPNQNISFIPTQNNTFRIDLSGGGNTVTAFAQIGSGAALVSAVPEPATWGMMLLGFGVVGFAMRRQRRATARFKVA